MPKLAESDPDIIDGVYYPSSDGKPMAETELHLLAMVQIFQLLRDHFRERSDVYVGSDMFWYWERGNPKACTAPDVMVNFGVSHNGVRRSFISWKENGVVPSVAFEMAAKKSWRKHLIKTKALYEEQGVKEYFLFDPEGLFLEAPLVGFRLRGGKYVRIAPKADGSMRSQELHLLLLPKGRHLRFADPVSGALLPTESEKTEREIERANQERRRADEAVRQTEQLQLELNRLRNEIRQQSHPNGHHNGKSAS